MAPDGRAPDLHEPTRGVRPVVLVIDDDPGLRESFRLILDDDFEVVDVPDGPRALEVVRSRHVDLALLDIRLPDMDGIEVLERIKAIDENVEVVLVTAVRTVRTAVAAMKLGAFDYLTKPFEEEEILSVIRRALERRSLQREVTFLRSELERRQGLGLTRDLLDSGRSAPTPVAPDPDAAEFAAPRPAEPEGGSRVTVSPTMLVVEDERGVRDLIVEILEMHDHRVARAHDADEAVVRARELGDDLVLLVVDAVLGGGPALPLVERLTGARPHLKVLWVSGELDDPRPPSDARLGAQSVIHKPFTVDALMGAVGGLLEPGPPSC